MDMLRLLRDIVARVDATEPTKVALLCREGRMTYGQLASRSLELAVGLEGRGIAQGDRVALFLPKSFDAVAGILACIRIGAPYVPVDVDQPVARLRRILNDCDPAAILTTSNLLSEVTSAEHDAAVIVTEDEFIEGEKIHLGADSDAVRRPEDLAFILYTSGSTGNPKGVQTSHRNILSFINWTLDEFDLSGDDVFASIARFSFDLSTFDLFSALAVGGSIRIFEVGEVTNPLGLAKRVEEDRITVWYSVPSILRLMLESGAFERYDCSSLRYVLFAGEPFPIAPLRKLYGKLSGALFYNLYGPTETNVCTYYKVESLDPKRTAPLPIGRPLPEVQTRIDQTNEPTEPHVVAGELVIEGPCVTPGYWKSLEGHNAENHRNGVHATGDLVSLEDGELIYHGRLDDMVKVDGFRVELGEIEQVLADHEDIKAVAVVPVQNGGRTLLYAFYVAQAPLSTFTIKRYCAQFLPRYMIPYRGVRVRKLPMNQNGKIDRKSLTLQVSSSES